MLCAVVVGFLVFYLTGVLLVGSTIQWIRWPASYGVVIMLLLPIVWRRSCRYRDTMSLFFEGERVCWDCLNVVPGREASPVGCARCAGHEGRRRTGEPKGPSQLGKPVNVPFPVASRTLKVGISAFLIGGAFAALNDNPLVRYPMGIIRIVISYVGIGISIAMFVWDPLGQHYRHKLRDKAREGQYYCWMCLYRIDNLAPGTERCPECGALVEISKVEMRRWLSEKP